MAVQRLWIVLVTISWKGQILIHTCFLCYIIMAKSQLKLMLTHLIELLVTELIQIVFTNLLIKDSHLLVYLSLHGCWEWPFCRYAKGVSQKYMHICRPITQNPFRKQMIPLNRKIWRLFTLRIPHGMSRRGETTRNTSASCYQYQILSTTLGIKGRKRRVFGILERELGRVLTMRAMSSEQKKQLCNLLLYSNID